MKAVEGFARSRAATDRAARSEDDHAVVAHTDRAARSTDPIFIEETIYFQQLYIIVMQ